MRVQAYSHPFHDSVQTFNIRQDYSSL
jgi:hypothetical protein